MVPRILDLGTRRWVVSFMPLILPSGKEPSIPVGWEAGWALEPVWTRWRRSKLPAHTGNRTPVASRYTEWATSALESITLTDYFFSCLHLSGKYWSGVCLGLTIVYAVHHELFSHLSVSIASVNKLKISELFDRDAISGNLRNLKVSQIDIGHWFKRYLTLALMLFTYKSRDFFGRKI
jgi:hypothetical protein